MVCDHPCAVLPAAHRCGHARAPDGPARVFGFATLTNPLVRLVVMGRWVPAEPAQLRGWQRGDGRDITEGAETCWTAWSSGHARRNDPP